MQALPPELSKLVPPHLLSIIQHQHQQQQSAIQSDKELARMVLDQWTPGLYALNFYRVDILPRSPFTKELTNAPPRSKYYETFLCTSVFFFAILLTRCLEYMLGGGRLRVLVKNPSIATWVQFAFLILPFLISVIDFPVKNYSTFSLAFDFACLVIYLGCRLHKRLTLKRTIASLIPHNADSAVKVVSALEINKLGDTSTAENSTSPIKKSPPYNDLLAMYRSIVYISTTVCIFARDQPCWNNSFSKTHSFGTSLMDVGIGCFVICIGSLGPTAIRPRDKVDRALALRKAAIQAGILTVCGLVKTVTVVIANLANNTEFDEAWTEYGMHWNAFYSMAAARGLGAALELLVLPSWLPPLAACGLLAATQEALLAAGLAEFVLAPGLPPMYNRSNLIGQNREGLVSVLGLVTLYFAGLQLGRWTKPREDGSRQQDRLDVFVRLLILMVGSALVRPLTMLNDGYWILPESRRLMNPAYCAWLLTFSCFCLGGGWLILRAANCLTVTGYGDDGAVQKRQTPLHLQQVDSAGLLYFLVSNLLTGLLNLILSRLFPNRESIDGAPCFLVVVAYTAAAFSCSRRVACYFSLGDMQALLMRRLWMI